MSQTFNILRGNKKTYPAEYTKKGVFHWNKIKIIVHRPVVWTDSNTQGINPEVWTVSLYKQGVSLTGLHPNVLIKSIKQAKDLVKEALTKTGLKKLNEMLKGYKIINEVAQRDKPGKPF